MKAIYDIFHVLLPSGEYRNVYGEPVVVKEQPSCVLKTIGAIERNGRFWTATRFERTDAMHDSREVYRFISAYNFARKRDALQYITEG
ncbi:MAG TPA: hypothetical protein VFR24_00125 [Candidatus Angelobacter sp.]|nr:hypothetical protein [Candidatus Angelobacter sp.]